MASFYILSFGYPSLTSSFTPLFPYPVNQYFLPVLSGHFLVYQILLNVFLRLQDHRLPSNLFMHTSFWLTLSLTLRFSVFITLLCLSLPHSVYPITISISSILYHSPFQDVSPLCASSPFLVSQIKNTLNAQKT